MLNPEKVREVLSKAISGDITPVPILRFDGTTYNENMDGVRLSRQYLRVFEVMKDGDWRTLDEIAQITGDQQQSISARLRDFRKIRLGGHEVLRRRRGDAKRGLFEYRLIVREAA